MGVVVIIWLFVDVVKVVDVGLSVSGVVGLSVVSGVSVDFVTIVALFVLCCRLSLAMHLPSRSFFWLIWLSWCVSSCIVSVLEDCESSSDM